MYTICRAIPTLWLAYVIWTMAEPPASTEEKSTPRTKPAKTGVAFDPLMGLRAFACLLVMMGHYFLIVVPYSRAGVSHIVNGLLTTSPWAGVWLFFTLSGFLMGKGFAFGRYSLDEMGMRSFMRNRLLRIGPIYFGSILVLSIFRYPVILGVRNWWILIQMAVFDYQGILPDSVMPPLWSVNAELQFYLLVPFLMLGLFLLQRRLGRAFLLLPVVLLCLGTCWRMVLVRYIPGVYPYVYTPLLSNMDIFVCGLSLSLFPRLPELSASARRWLGWGLFASVPVFYVGISMLTEDRARFHMTIFDYLARVPWVAVVFAGTFIYLSEQMGTVKLTSSGKSLLLGAVGWMGTLTYCLYIFHSDVFYGMASLLPLPRSLAASLSNFPRAMVETFVVAAFFYFMVEKPFERRKKVRGTALTDAP